MSESWNDANPYNPYAQRVFLKTLQQKFDYQGVYTHTTDHFSLLCPTKTGTTSLRAYFDDAKISNTEADWESSDQKIIMLRHPMERYWSGLMTMLNYPENSQLPDGEISQTFNVSWRSHVFPVYYLLENYKQDFRFILMKDLYLYIPKHYNLNPSAPEGEYSNPDLHLMYDKVKKRRDLFAELHRQRDEWWLRREITAYSEILRTREKIGPEEFKILLKKSIKK